MRGRRCGEFLGASSTKIWGRRRSIQFAFLGVTTYRTGVRILEKLVTKSTRDETI